MTQQETDSIQNNTVLPEQSADSHIDAGCEHMFSFIVGLGGEIISTAGVVCVGIGDRGRLGKPAACGFSPDLYNFVFEQNQCSQAEIEAWNREKMNFPEGSREWRWYQEQIDSKLLKQNQLKSCIDWVNTHLEGVSFQNLPLEEQKKVFEKLYPVLSNHPSARMDLYRMVNVVQKRFNTIGIVLDPEMVAKAGGVASYGNGVVSLGNVDNAVLSGSFFHEIMHGEQDALKQKIFTNDATGALYMFAREAEGRAINHLHFSAIPVIDKLAAVSKQETDTCVRAFQHFLGGGYNSTEAQVFTHFLKNHAKELGGSYNEIAQAFAYPSQANEYLRAYTTQAFTEYRLRGYTMQLYLSSPQNRSTFLNRFGIQLTPDDIKELNYWHDGYQRQLMRYKDVYLSGTDGFSPQKINELKIHFYNRYGVMLPLEDAFEDYRQAKTRLGMPVQVHGAGYRHSRAIKGLENNYKGIVNEYNLASQELGELRAQANGMLNGSERGSRGTKKGKGTKSGKARRSRLAKGGSWGNALLFLGTLALVGTGAATAIEMSEAQKVQKINMLVDELAHDSAVIKADTPNPSSAEWLEMLQTLRSEASGEMALTLDMMIQATQQGKPIDFYDIAVQTGQIQPLQSEDENNPYLSRLYRAQEEYLRATINKQMIEAVQTAMQERNRVQNNAHNEISETGGLRQTLSLNVQSDVVEMASVDNNTLKENSDGQVRIQEEGALSVDTERGRA